MHCNLINVSSMKKKALKELKDLSDELFSKADIPWEKSKDEIWIDFSVRL